MTPDKILVEPPRALNQQQRKRFFEKGYLLVKSAVSEEWVNKLRDLSLEFVERSRKESESGRDFDLAPGHSAPCDLGRSYGNLDRGKFLGRLLRLQPELGCQCVQ